MGFEPTTPGMQSRCAPVAPLARAPRRYFLAAVKHYNRRPTQEAGAPPPGQRKPTLDARASTLKMKPGRPSHRQRFPSKRISLTAVAQVSITPSWAHHHMIQRLMPDSSMTRLSTHSYSSLRPVRRSRTNGQIHSLSESTRLGHSKVFICHPDLICSYQTVPSIAPFVLLEIYPHPRKTYPPRQGKVTGRTYAVL